MQTHSSEYTCKIIGPADVEEYKKVIELRQAFVELGDAPEHLHLDDDKCDIYLLYKGDEPVATARTHYTPSKGYKLQRFAVLASNRSKGYGRTIMDEILRRLLPILKPGEQITLSSRFSRISFYERCGFQICGDFILEFGVPCRPMAYPLNKAPMQKL